jgi:predicted TIM-barrel fold metal-dependent hydrolase
MTDTTVDRNLDVGFVSADSHVNEPRDLWSSNLPPSLREKAMRGIEAGDDGGWKLVIDGQHIFQKTMQEEADRLKVLDAHERMAVMRTDGIVAECIFPSIGLYVWMLEDAAGGQASCRIYNEWIYEQMQSKSPRFCCAGLIPTWTPEQALDEVTFVAELGLRAIMLPAIVEPMWNHRDWAPLWELIERTGLPVVMHQGTGHDMVWYRGPGATIANLVSTQGMAPRVATMLATSGVLERHTGIHVVFVEFNGGWLAPTMETADYYDDAFRRYDEFRVAARNRPTIYPDLPNVPSYYMRRQLHATFQVDKVALANMVWTGPDALMWGSDYPHEEGTYPHSRKIVAEQAASLPREVAVKVFRENAIDVFQFDRNVIDQPF